MIPLARKLRDTGNNIFIGSGKEHLSFFSHELEGISYIDFPGFKPRYSQIVPQYITLLLQLPSLLYHIIREHYRLKTIIREYEIDIVISDNRFGLWNRKIKTVYITHMPVIPFPKPFRFLEFTGEFLHHLIIKKYNFCFIPDLPGEPNISGRLTHGKRLPGNVRFIGLLSRFTDNGFSPLNSSEKLKQTTVILSGPEPQRSLLKKKLSEILKVKGSPAVMLEGHPEIKNEIVKSENITFFNHLNTSEMKDILMRSEWIITRAGYSTIMELISINCNALLIPTPGQTEQEYLAGYLSEKGWFTSLSQRNLKTANLLFPDKDNWSETLNEKSEALLTEAIKNLLQE